MEKKVSPSSTKNEIMDAYNDLLKQINEKNAGQPKDIKEKEEKTNTLNTALTINKEGIIKQIANLKLSLNAELEKVEDSLLTESKKLSQVQDAIITQEERLKELYNINATADSVSIMLALQKDKKEVFEKEIEQKRLQLETEIYETRQKWEKEKKDSELLMKEEKDRLLKQRKRDEEEYSYNLELARKKDKDQYELKKQTLEKELIDKKSSFEQEIKSREMAVIAAELELSELREKVKSFPNEMEQGIKESVALNTDKLVTAHKYETQLKVTSFESEIKLRDQEISSCKTKIKDLEVQLTQFASKAEQSDKSAKEIAIKAIESSSNYKIIDRVRESKEDNGK